MIPDDRSAAATDDPFALLLRFHQEVLLPDLARVIGAASERLNGRFDGVCVSLDAFDKRLDRVEAETQVLAAGVRRIEERMTALEQCLDRIDVG